MLLKKSLNLNKLQFYIKHISIVNVLFLPDAMKLSTKEIEVIASFIKQGEGLDSEYMFSTLNRDKVMKEVKVSHGGLSNYLRQLKEKKIILETDKGLFIPKIFYPTNLNNQTYEITLNLQNGT